MTPLNEMIHRKQHRIARRRTHDGTVIARPGEDMIEPRQNLRRSTLDVR